MNGQLGAEQLRWIFAGMGALFLLLGLGLAWMEVRLRNSLTRGEGIMVDTVFSHESRKQVPVVEVPWQGRTVRVEAAPAPIDFMNAHLGKQVTVWLGEKAGKLSGLPKCFIDTGKPGALPGIRRVLLFVVIFCVVGAGMTAAAFLIS